MKTIAILLMVLGILMIVGTGFMYLLGFAMSFDAPGSESDPAAWRMRLLMFMPTIVLVVVLIFAWLAYRSGHYARSMYIGLAFPLMVVVLFLMLFITSFTTMRSLREVQLQDAENARLYPVQKFLRAVDGGTDTIIVFPSRIVAYRLYVGTEFPYAGPLGDLNVTRDTLIFNNSSDTKINREELPHFTDSEGRKFTDVYAIR